MVNKQQSSALLVLLAFIGVAYAQPVNKPALRQELLERAEQDQKVRAELPADPAKTPLALVRRVHSLDRANTAWLKRVVRKYGWPGKSLVGKDGAFAAWLLVQHADLDPGFQRRCLKLMEKAVKAGEASGQDYAYLVDRVRTKDGKPQLYGTQLKFVDGKYVPLPIEDEANVDKRRAAVGLPTIAEYLKAALEP
jgi:uncharacterized protein DUF6624